MRVDDLTVEVRDRDLKRKGQVTPLSLDLKARTKWCAVGEWTLTLPGNHPMVPYLQEPGSGLLVTGPEGEVVYPAEYSPWAVERTNLMKNPKPVAYAGSAWSQPSTGSVTADGVTSTLTSTTTPYLFTASTVDGALAGRVYAFRAKVRALMAPGSVATQIQMRPHVRVGNAYYTPTQGAVWVPADGQQYEVAFYHKMTVDVPLASGFELSGVGNGTGLAGSVLSFDDVLIEDVGTEIPTTPPGPFFWGGSAGDGDLLRYRWTGGVGISTAVRETRAITREPWRETVYGPLFSGPTRTPSRVRNSKNPDGTFTFSGVTDEVILQGARAFPDPAIADPQLSSRSKERDARSGSTEDLLRQYVAKNIAQEAPSGRLRGFRTHLVVPGASASRGLSQAKSPRFQNLLELLQEMVAYDPNLGFRVVQVDETLEFQVLDARDRTKFIRFDIENGTITSEEVQSSGPIVTDAFAAGQGEGVERTIVRRQTPESIAAEADWGLVFEQFIDQRDTDDLAELQQSGDEALLEGAGGTAVKMVPSDDTTMQVNVDWRQGDAVTTVVNGIETVARVTEVAYQVTSAGVMAGAALGDVSGFTQKDSESTRVQSLDQRVSNLERTGGLLPARLEAAGRQTTDWNNAIEAGFWWSDLSAANRPPSQAAFIAGSVFPGMVSGSLVMFQEVRTAGDPSQATVLSRYRSSAGVWTPWRLNGLGRGPAAIRNAVTPQYWDQWNDTDGDTGLYVGSKTGTWRRMHGYVGGTVKAWDASVANINGRTEAFTIPTVLETNEYLAVEPVALGTGYATLGVVAIARNPTNTTLSVRLMQFMNTATQSISFVWQIVQY